MFNNNEIQPSVAALVAAAWAAKRAAQADQWAIKEPNMPELEELRITAPNPAADRR